MIEAPAAVAATPVTEVPVSTERPPDFEHEPFPVTELPPLPSPETTEPLPEMPQGDFSNPPPLNVSSRSDDTLRAKAAEPFDKSKAEVVARDATSVTYQRDDGLQTTQVFASPVNWQDDSGEWHEIDTTLERDDNGAYTTRSAPVTVTIAATASDLRRSASPTEPPWDPRRLSTLE